MEIKEAAVASFGWWVVVVIAPHMVGEMEMVVVVVPHMVGEMVVAGAVAAANLEVEEVKLGLELVVEKEAVVVESECNILEVVVKIQGLVVVVVVVQEGEVSKLVAVAMTDI